ncbi:hypothetical protein [Aneurinibacillus tyrosinisolvens]|uniref:hypothetical protein n=1 Tax=Aneurinibacillus tyrosinisolvens TaxID=1443435 RepID=UPI00063F5271|nr:hypothetical protein [Aneurinibacillus tyrosinisolvens]
MQKPEIELLSILSKMIYEYEETNGPLYYYIKKINGIFLFVYVNQNLLEGLGLPKSFIGMDIYNPIFSKQFSDRVYTIFEEAWGGNTVFYYAMLPTNPDVFFVCMLKPIKKEGIVVEAKGHCVLFNKTDFEQFTGVVTSMGVCEICEKLGGGRNLQ